jgi:2-polyprenyl-3-methyl-5-hydroxy-6-metoxy-1,4-benzoquinol methylase
MLEEEGYKVDIYDKFYYNNQAIFNNKYDFITATEVIEHLAKPGEELARLYGMLNVGGVLAVMTNILRDDITFSSWYYKDDPTHICFYSKNTMNYLAKKWNVDVKFYGKNVALFFK